MNRTRLGGVALIGAPLTLLAAALLHPEEVSDPARQLDIVSGSLNRWYAAHLLYMVGFLLMVPAVLALASRLGDRAPRLRLWGSSLTILGLFSSAGIVAVEGFGGWQLAQSADRADAVATFDRIIHSAGIAIPFGILGLAVTAGLILVAVGLGRTWEAWTLAAGAILLAAGLASSTQPVLVAGLAGIAATLVTAGLSDLGVGPLSLQPPAQSTVRTAH